MEIAIEIDPDCDPDFDPDLDGRGGRAATVRDRA
jgi:hypothetical protein